jgi:hypothetical protein
LAPATCSPWAAAAALDGTAWSVDFGAIDPTDLAAIWGVEGRSVAGRHPNGRVFRWNGTRWTT